MIAPAAIGGAETVVLSLCAGLAESGVRVGLIAIVREEGTHPFVHEADRLGLGPRTVPSGRRYFRQAREIARLLRETGATVLHTHGLHADIVGYLAGRLARLPVVSTLHGFSGSGLRDALYTAVLGYTQRRAAAVIAVSREVERRLLDRGVARARLALIPNALRARSAPATRTESRATLGIPDDHTAIGWVGRLSVEKDADLAIRAIALTQPSLHLHVIGTGPEAAALAALSAQLRLDERIHFHGQVSDAARWMAAFDALLLSSRTEGTPMVLLEAMRARVPIVATAVGGVPDMLGPAEAWLTPPARPHELAAALTEATGNPIEAMKRAASAHERLVNAHAPERWIARHQQLYADIGRPG